MKGCASTSAIIALEQIKNIFHKKCTDLKSKSGSWKPPRWFCSKCTEELKDDISPEKDKYVIEKPNSKHRKANVGACDHPDIEFLESQIITLKSVVARRETEVKKLKESDNLKAKHIMQLESQLTEARNTVCLQEIYNKHCK